MNASSMAGLRIATAGQCGIAGTVSRADTPSEVAFSVDGNPRRESGPNAALTGGVGGLKPIAAPRDGVLVLPGESGLGVALDEDRLAATRIG
ncbi:MAG: hypothetical protein RLO51_20560 [Thalassobaculum sp.]|uniref:hypothetical protein n=1 Tax=Thalassobaculum sp. TaxID=2022740 RepID=UPI0032ED8F7C